MLRLYALRALRVLPRTAPLLATLAILLLLPRAQTLAPRSKHGLVAPHRAILGTSHTRHWLDGFVRLQNMRRDING